ncbi:hypothetical protein [Acidithiobacillus ferriphilus]|nr:hypothetical protein [Acidithiobacillus ferriphilus]
MSKMPTQEWTKIVEGLLAAFAICRHCPRGRVEIDSLRGTAVAD